MTRQTHVSAPSLRASAGIAADVGRSDRALSREAWDRHKMDGKLEAAADDVQRAEPQWLVGETETPASRILRRGRWWMAGGAVLAVLAAVYLLSGADGAAVRYVTEPVTRGDLRVTVTAVGSVQPISQVDISSEQSGTVRSVRVTYNDAVTAGQVLAELDTDKFRANVASSRAKLSAAKAKLAEADITVEDARRTLDRKAWLAASQSASRQDYDTAKTAYDRVVAQRVSAEADIEVAEAELALNEANLAKTQIVAPIDGIILTRSVNPGQTVASTLQAPVLFSVAGDLRKMEVRVDIDEADIGQVREGQSASFTVDAFPGRRFPAVIRELRYASETVQGVVTYKAVLTVDNSDLLLRPGMTATANIVVQQVADTLLVPNSALRFTPPATNASNEPGFLRSLLPGPPRFRGASSRVGEDHRVWLLGENGPSIEVAVTPAGSDGSRTAIANGVLAEGAQVIVDTVKIGR